MRHGMNKKIYVFDLDGTLVDSMKYFARGILSIADEAGISYDDELLKILTPLGYSKSAVYYKERFGLSDSVENIYAKIEGRLVKEYSENIVLKDGVGEYLYKIYGEGGRLFVLTASPHSVTDVCLARNGVFDLFENVWSVEDFGLSKTGTELFFRVAEDIGCSPEEINYFDDSLIALENAGKAGYHTYGVYDAQTEEEVKRMKNGLCDEVVMTFADFS
jgi:beta-phosphoglucomutase-like phosphatase (HAD superfamily)